MFKKIIVSGGEPVNLGSAEKHKKLETMCSARDRNSREMEECSLRDDKENQAPNNHKAVHFFKFV